MDPQAWVVPGGPAPVVLFEDVTSVSVTLRPKDYAGETFPRPQLENRNRTISPESAFQLNQKVDFGSNHFIKSPKMNTTCSLN